MNIPDGTKVRKSQCATCVFRPERDGGIHLTPERRAEISAYLIDGCNQLCHSDSDRTVCRGGRDFQLTLYARLGLIEEATDEALRDAMRRQGLEPRSHV